MATNVRKRKSVEQSMLTINGGEPIVTQELYREKFLIAINWYNANTDEKQIRAYAEQYVKSSADLKQYIYPVSKASFLEIKAVGIIGRLIKRGQHVDIADMLKVLERLENLSQQYKKVVVAPAAVHAVATPVSVQDRIMDSARRVACDVDQQIDSFVETKQTDFSMKSYLLTNSVSGAVSKKIGEFYKQTVIELEDAIKGKDVQLKEGYSNFTKVQLKKLCELVKQIIADCTQQVVTAKTSRKPRVRKSKPASVIVSKIKYLKEDPQLKLKSISPTEIIGSSELWVYVPDKRKLTVYRGADNGHLGVSGMSITNYDVEKSETKTIRKPEEFFKQLTSTGKRAMANAWKALKSKVSKPRSRINEEMLLLAAN